MEFITTKKYLRGNFNRVIKYEELKILRAIEVGQDLNLRNDKENLGLLEQYGNEGYKIIPIKRISFNSNALLDDFPKRVMVEMTGRCNLACRMCPRKDMKRPLVNMDKELYKKIINELDEYGIDAFWFFHFGESILHPDWKELVSYAGEKKNLGITWFSTNGVLFGEEEIDFVLNSKITFLNYSLHGTNEEVYSFVSSKENYPNVRKHLEMILWKKKELGKGPIIHIQMIDQEGTHHDIDEFLETFYRTGEILSIISLEYTNLPENRYGLKRNRSGELKKCNRISRGDCFVDCSGFVKLCDADYDSLRAIGNLRDGTLHEFWNSPARKLVYELNDQGRMFELECCRDCADFDL
ncbi:MAG: radical SAM protein [Candidatus Paceibacterota bacterium]